MCAELVLCVLGPPFVALDRTPEFIDYPLALLCDRERPATLGYDVGLGEIETLFQCSQRSPHDRCDYVLRDHPDGVPDESPHKPE